MTKSSSRHSSRLAEGALLAAAALLYARTMSHSIAIGDAGELALAATVVGVPHPPGYPLYTLLARLASLVPLGTIVMRLNYFSIVCALAALFLHLRIGERLGLSLVPRLAATALLAGSYTFWSQASIVEVYALHLLLVHAVLLVAIDSAAPEGGGWGRASFLLAYLLALAAAHHPSSLLLVPVALTSWALATNARSAKAAAPPADVAARAAAAAAPVKFVVLALLASIPFTLFFVLLVRSRANPAIDWGNPETVPALVAHAARTRYGDLRHFARPAGLLAGQIAAFARILADDLSPVIACGVPAGFAVLVMAKRHAGGLVLLAFLLFSLGTIFLVNFPLTDLALYDNRVFFLPAISAGALASGALLAAVGSFAAALAPQRRRRAIAAALATLILALAIVPAARRIPRLDRRDHTVAADLGRALLVPIDPGATLLASEGQAVHSLAYVSGVLGFRPDVRVVDRLGVLGGGRGIGGRAPAAGRPAGGALFATDAEALRARGLHPVPYGLAYRGGVDEASVSPGVWESFSFRRPEKVEAIDFAERDVLVGTYLRMAEHVAWAGLRVRGESAIDEARRIAGDEARRRFAADFARAYEAVGLADSAVAAWRDAAAAAPSDPLVRRAGALVAGRFGRWVAAESLLADASRLAPHDVAILVELGSARFALGDSARARAAWETALRFDPDNPEAKRGIGMLRER